MNIKTPFTTPLKRFLWPEETGRERERERSNTHPPIELAIYFFVVVVEKVAYVV